MEDDKRVVYPIMVTDTCCRTIYVKAGSLDAALDCAKRMNESGEVDVGYEYYIDSSYELDLAEVEVRSDRDCWEFEDEDCSTLRGSSQSKGA